MKILVFNMLGRTIKNKYFPPYVAVGWDKIVSGHFPTESKQTPPISRIDKSLSVLVYFKNTSKTPDAQTSPREN